MGPSVTITELAAVVSVAVMGLMYATAPPAASSQHAQRSMGVRVRYGSLVW